MTIRPSLHLIQLTQIRTTGGQRGQDQPLGLSACIATAFKHILSFETASVTDCFYRLGDKD